MEYVKVLLNKVDVNKNAGPDGIPNIFLKNTSENLAILLVEICNKSLEEGTCPFIFKSSFLTPIFKKGDKSDIRNHRSVCILNAMAKVFEKIIRDYIFSHIRHLVSTKQHGFVCNRSTITNLLEFTNYVSTSLEESLEVHSIYTDFSKAFDKVNISILLSKLAAFGIRGRLFQWFKSYLYDRCQYVVFNGCKSE